jgi:hypothetical protein
MSRPDEPFVVFGTPSGVSADGSIATLGVNSYGVICYYRRMHMGSPVQAVDALVTSYIGMDCEIAEAILDPLTRVEQSGVLDCLVIPSPGPEEKPDA